MLIFAIVAALVFYPIAAPDSFTLRTTRGAVGAVMAMARPTRSGTRSTPTRSTPRPTRSTRPPTRSKAGSTRPDPTPTPTRPGSRSRLAAGIRGWIRSADAATTRRQELHDAVHEALERWRAGRAKRRQAVAQVADENARALQDRAQQRAQSSDAVKQAAARIPTQPPAPPAQPNGAAVADTTAIPMTELDTLDHLIGEIDAALQATEQTSNAWLPIQNWLNSISERYQVARDLPKTPRMDAAEATVSEVGQQHVLLFLNDVAEKLKWFRQAVTEEQARLKEIGPSTGRLENVSS